MANLLPTSLLPRSLTQLFADNKKSYEALVDDHVRRTAPELSRLNLRLRIQKDRLIAWGIQWSDRSTSHGGDMDGLLDRAGISDLVADVMCTIRLLLDEAEALQAEAAGPSADPAAKRRVSPSSAFAAPGQWTGHGIARLEEILTDLTTSIDTLCDLSRPKMEGFGKGLAPRKAEPPTSPEEPPKGLRRRGQADGATPQRVASLVQRNPPSRRDDLADMTFLDPALFRVPQPAPDAATSAAPPSYESVAAGAENRVLARFAVPPAVAGAAANAGPADANDTLVLLDYRPAAERGGRPRLPDHARFEELLLALAQLAEPPAGAPAGTLKLMGWTVDAARGRYAYAYEVPRPAAAAAAAAAVAQPAEDPQPRSLLSFLQNGGDAESGNVPCLESRFRLALHVAASVRAIHGAHVTHRNINSDNLLYVLGGGLARRRDKFWKGPFVRTPYLTGFLPRGPELTTADADAPFTGLYHHPQLFGPGRRAYAPAHDYYSLGLVLLEVGLWMPIGKFWKARYSLRDFKLRLQDVYLRKLSSKCGDGYMHAVLYCLTAADSLGRRGGSSGAADPATDGRDLASAFHRNVIRPLERCCRIEWDAASGEIEASGMQLPASPQPEASTAVAELPSRSATLAEHPERKRFSRHMSEQGTQTAGPREHTEAPAPPAAALQPQQPAESKLTVWSHELPQLYTSYWSSTMYPKLEKILRKAISRWESYSIDLFMAGADPDTARPTVYMECASTHKVRRILRFLNKELRLFDIRVVPGQIVRSKVAKRKKRRPGKGRGHAAADGSRPVEDLNPHYQEQPQCGASIGAYVDGHHLPPVTFGGAVLVDGEPFGMSVHHMLEDEDEIESGLDDVVDLRRAMAPSGDDDDDADRDPFDASDLSDADSVSSGGYAFSASSRAPSTYLPEAPSVPYPFDVPADLPDRWADAGDANPDDPDTDFWLHPSFSSLSLSPSSPSPSAADDDCDLGDTVGVAPDARAPPLVTQPALDDVGAGFFPRAADAAAEHLASHAWGHVHASSGLRRARTPDAALHEIDWALIRPRPARRLGPGHVCPAAAPASASPPPPPSSPPPPPSSPPSSGGGGGGGGAAAPRGPTAILPAAALAARRVHAHGRSAGAFARGTILPAMRLVRLPGRASPAHAWPVRGGFGAGGDSGAWVLDDAAGALCGHVLAHSAAAGVAYLSPMEVLVQDMERVLGKTVALPAAGVALVRAGSAEAVGREGSPVCPTSPPWLQSAEGSAVGLAERGLEKGRPVDLPVRERGMAGAAVAAAV